MKNVVFIFITTIFMYSPSTFAGGYAGNGGGLVEQNFNFAYSSLPRLIESASVMIYQQFSEAEYAVLRQIAVIANQNTSNAKRMVFLSGKEHPEIFNTSPEELHRLAVTTYTPGDTIFINGDLLYSEAGKPTLNLGEIISILTHEVGHQTGEKDHQFLDIIGSKLRNYFNQNSLSYEILKGDENLIFSVLNQRGLYSTSQLIYQNSQKTFDLTPAVVEKMNKKMKEKGYQNLSGFFLTNGNFKLEQIPHRYIFQIWVNASFAAKAENGQSFITELFPVEFEVNADNSVSSID